jgi:hypothetical protein
MWKAELEKKGSDMSADEAYEVLGKYKSEKLLGFHIIFRYIVMK